MSTRAKLTARAFQDNLHTFVDSLDKLGLSQQVINDLRNDLDTAASFGNPQSRYHQEAKHNLEIVSMELDGTETGYKLTVVSSIPNDNGQDPITDTLAAESKTETRLERPVGYQWAEFPAEGEDLLTSSSLRFKDTQNRIATSSERQETKKSSCSEFEERDYHLGLGPPIWVQRRDPNSNLGSEWVMDVTAMKDRAWNGE